MRQPSLFSDTEQLVSVHNGQAVTTSFQVAEVFEKTHFNVLRDIRGLDCSPRFRQINFESSFIIKSIGNSKGYRKLPFYYITRDGFTFLAMGFTGKVAAKFKEDYINAFNEMERRLREDSRDWELSLAAKMLDRGVDWLNSSLKKFAEKHGDALVPYGDVRFGIIPTEGDFEAKLSNLFAQLKCAYLDALSLARKRLDAEEALRRLNRESWLTLNKIK